MAEVGDAIENIVQYGLPDNYYTTYASKVRALSINDLTAAGKSFLNPDRLVWVVVGDLAKVEAGIRELNLGTAHVVDADGNPIR
jgi:zinc protease